MIIQLLGANGAGKSTVVQELMGVRPRVPLYLWDRRVPDAYSLPDCYVVGHYEGQACGGGDTIPRAKLSRTIERVLEVAGRRPVLLEGPTGREPTLAGDVRVVYLRRPVAACLGNWIVRNQSKGLRTNVPVMERRVNSCIVRIERMMQAYEQASITTHVVRSRAEALGCIREMLT